MDYSKLLVISAIFFGSLFYVGLSADQNQTEDIAGKAQVEFQCMQSFLPCQNALKAPNDPPPPACCDPLKKMIENDQKCICVVFNNPPLLKSMSVTQEDALKLPKGCGAEADLSKCKALEKEAADSLASASGKGSGESSSEGGSASSSAGTGSAESSKANGLSPFSMTVILCPVVTWTSLFI